MWAGIQEWYHSLGLWNVLILANAVCGIHLLETSLKRLDRIRKIDEARDAKFPQWRRNDAKFWTRPYLYLGASTIMIPRIIFFTLVFVGTMIISRIIFIGKTIKKGDSVQGPRKTVTNYFYTLCSLICLLTLGIVPVTDRIHSVDYSKYIGKGIPPQQPKTGKHGTIVSNHMGFFDILLLTYVYRGDIGFAATAKFGTFPVLGFMCKILECTFVPRSTDAASL